MHTLYINYHYDNDLTTIASLLERYHSSRNWCEAVAKQGGSISYIQRFRYTDHQAINGVDYYFINDNLPPHLSWYQNPKTFHKQIIKLKADVIHYNGQIFHLKYLRSLLPKETAVVWQHHGGLPPSFLKRLIYKPAFRLLDDVMFTSFEQAEEWKKVDLISPHQAVHEIIESSTFFTPLPREHARSTLGLQGGEIFLWVGRLNTIKDPLTILKGFALSLKLFKNPHLYMIYSEKDLLADVQKAILSLSLSERVHLVGKVPHDELPKYYSGADYFVLGSLHEGSGFALLEAMACGALPIVTDIPSFRKITRNGTVGYLWKVGSPHSLAVTLGSAQSKTMSRDSIVAYFKKNLSFDCVGHEALSIYRQVWQRRQSTRNEN
ncbi:MAG: glycosyltransferase family 4 protein [Ignavibacteriales bacterium]|nr:glycosyltransferase family 4 protein [Ignavibacteriales bacterium]